LNRASILPSRKSSPTQSLGTTPSQRSKGSAGGSGSRSRDGSASTVFIPADDVPEMGSTISSPTRSSFQSVPMESPYHSESYHSAHHPRSIDDTSSSRLSLPLPLTCLSCPRVDRPARTPEVRQYPRLFTPDHQFRRYHLLTGLFRTYCQR
jgi:hypothetical protein